MVTGLRVLPGADPMGEWELRRAWAAGSSIRDDAEETQPNGLREHARMRLCMRARGIMCSVSRSVESSGFDESRGVAWSSGADKRFLRSHGSWRIASLLFVGCETSCAVQLVLLGVLAEPRCP